MLQSIKEWFQDWSDACEYAKECAPDLSFLTPREPYTALAGIAAVCALLWWWNERRGQIWRVAAESAAPEANDPASCAAPAFEAPAAVGLAPQQRQKAA